MTAWTPARVRSHRRHARHLRELPQRHAGDRQDRRTTSRPRRAARPATRPRLDPGAVRPRQCHAGYLRQCHNGTTATGKNPQHIRTTQRLRYLPQHDGLDAGARSTTPSDRHLRELPQRHQGDRQAARPHPDHARLRHLPLVTAWTPARFDHTGVAPGTCASCHNGTQATGKPANHIATTASCDACHSTVAWTPAQFDHANVAPGTCAQCHNGTQATGKPGNHWQTALSCDSCHRTTAWTPVTHQHTSPDYPGDHRGPPACTACHTTNRDAVTWQFPQYRPNCAGCHANDYDQGEGRHTTLVQDQDCGRCHRVNSGNWGN